MWLASSTNAAADSLVALSNRVLFSGEMDMGFLMGPTTDEGKYTEDEVVRRMNSAVRRALDTPPTHLKDIVGKSDRAATRGKSRVKKAAQTKPKAP
jgi:hypothetical protein